MSALLDRRLLFVVGKGGVGKTTVSAALAKAAAARGKRVLVAMCHCKERLSGLFESPPIGSEVINVAPNIDAVNMDPKVALKEYGLLILKVEALYNAIFENRFVRAFLHGTPGIEAWSMLGKAFFHASPPSGSPSYDLVIIDAPATGHALDMLRVPQIIHEVAPPGLLRKEADRCLAFLRDERTGGAVVVTLPEDMPTNETLELDAALRNELRIPVASLVVNRVLPELFTDGPVADAVEGLPSALGDEHAAADLARAGRARVLRERVQRESIDRLRTQQSATPVMLPALPEAELGVAQVDLLAAPFG